MKRLLLIVTVFLFAAAPAFPQTSKKAQAKSTIRISKKTIKSSPAKVEAPLNESVITPDGKYKVTGKVTRSRSYCGGAYPGPERLAEITAPHPSVGVKVYVRKGETNSNSPVIAEATTDSTGNFVLYLLPGTYCITDAERLEPLNPDRYKGDGQYILSASKECLEDWWKQGLTKIEVKDKGISGLEFNYYDRCFTPGDCPCMQYVGPMPP
jgi:hypothetical protein